MDKFAKLWPDTLSPVETLRDLDYEPEVTLPRMVAAVLNAHSGRRMTSRAGFRSIDTCAHSPARPSPARPSPAQPRLAPGDVRCHGTHARTHRTRARTHAHAHVNT